jgi:hypothetical protein
MGTVTQDVRAFPSWEACEQTRQQMMHTAGRLQTTIQIKDPQTGQPTTAQQGIVWLCKSGTH